jgi:hypothetical protein
MEGTPVKLLYTIALSFFALAAPVAAHAQSFEVSLISALCSDDYYEDTAGQCSALFAGEAFTLEAILKKYGATITPDADDEIVVLYLMDDPEDIPVGSVQPRTENPDTGEANVTDDESSAETAIEQESIASQVVDAESPHQNGDGAVDEVTITGPTARHIPASDGPIDDNRAIE